MLLSNNKERLELLQKTEKILDEILYIIGVKNDYLKYISINPTKKEEGLLSFLKYSIELTKFIYENKKRPDWFDYNISRYEEYNTKLKVYNKFKLLYERIFLDKNKICSGAQLFSQNSNLFSEDELSAFLQGYADYVVSKDVISKSVDIDCGDNLPIFDEGKEYTVKSVICQTNATLCDKQYYVYLLSLKYVLFDCSCFLNEKNIGKMELPNTKKLFFYGYSDFVNNDSLSNFVIKNLQKMCTYFVVEEGFTEKEAWKKIFKTDMEVAKNIKAGKLLPEECKDIVFKFYFPNILNRFYFLRMDLVYSEENILKLFDNYGMVYSIPTNDWDDWFEIIYRYNYIILKINELSGTVETYNKLKYLHDQVLQINHEGQNVNSEIIKSRIKDPFLHLKYPLYRQIAELINKILDIIPSLHTKYFYGELRYKATSVLAEVKQCICELDKENLNIYIWFCFNNLEQALLSFLIDFNDDSFFYENEMTKESLACNSKHQIQEIEDDIYELYCRACYIDCNDNVSSVSKEELTNMLCDSNSNWSISERKVHFAKLIAGIMFEILECVHGIVASKTIDEMVKAEVDDMMKAKDGSFAIQSIVERQCSFYQQNGDVDLKNATSYLYDEYFRAEKAEDPEQLFNTCFLKEEVEELMECKSALTTVCSLSPKKSQVQIQNIQEWMLEDFDSKKLCVFLKLVCIFDTIASLTEGTCDNYQNEQARLDAKESKAESVDITPCVKSSKAGVKESVAASVSQDSETETNIKEKIGEIKDTNNPEDLQMKKEDLLVKIYDYLVRNNLHDSLTVRRGTIAIIAYYFLGLPLGNHNAIARIIVSSQGIEQDKLTNIMSFLSLENKKKEEKVKAGIKYSNKELEFGKEALAFSRMIRSIYNNSRDCWKKYANDNDIDTKKGELSFFDFIREVFYDVIEENNIKKIMKNVQELNKKFNLNSLVSSWV